MESALTMKIVEEISDHRSRNKILLTTPYVHIVRTNLLLLRALLDVKKLRGVLIVVDRPYQYVVSLLKVHNISQKNLMYVDTVTNISKMVFAEGENVKFLDGPFQVNLLSGAFSLGFEDESTQRTTINLNDIDFILIDNISTMLMYNPLAMVKSFVENFMKVVKEQKNLLVGIVIDKNTHKELYNVLKPYCDREIEVKEEWLIGRKKK